jgi:hypothetical protein
MTELKQITSSTNLKDGDVVEFKFKYNGGLWLKSAQVAFFEEQLKLKPELELISSTYGDTYATLRFRIHLAAGTPSFLQTVTVESISAGIIAIGWWLGLGMVLDSAYQVAEKSVEVAADAVSSAADAVAGVASNWKLILAVIVVICGLIIWRKVR